MARTKQTPPRMTGTGTQEFTYRNEKQTARMSTGPPEREREREPQGEPEPPKKKPRTGDTAGGERETGAPEEGHHQGQCEWLEPEHDEPEAELTGDETGDDFGYETGDETSDEDDAEAMLSSTCRERSVDIDVCTEELLAMFDEHKRLFRRIKKYVSRIKEDREAIKAANRRAGRSLYGESY